MDNARHAWERPGVHPAALAIMMALTANDAAPPAAAADPQAEAEAMYRRAESDDAAGRYARALDEYRATAALLPSSRYAPRAASRASTLAAHAEGDFAPYARLEQVRRDPELSSDAAAIDALARDADAFPPGLVRVEARMVCADAYLHRLGRVDDGMRVLRAVLDDPKSDPLTLHQASRALVDAYVDRGELDAALATASARARENMLDPMALDEVKELVRRRALHRVSIANLALLAAGTVTSVVLALRRGRGAAIARALRKLAPLAIGFAAYIAAAGAWLASAYEAGNARPFLIFGSTLVPLVFAARAWSAAGSPQPWARALRSVVCAAGVMSASFLLLEWIDPAYLEGFGL